jgi:hypothetical protein
MTTQTVPNRTQLRGIARRGKRRTKPPLAAVSPHLPGDHACAVRQMYLLFGTDGHTVGAADIADFHRSGGMNPCSKALHPDFPWKA